jgi:uncharacterized protein (DUF362 family)
MPNSRLQPAVNSLVAITRLPSPTYPSSPRTTADDDNDVSQALTRLAARMGWSDDHGPFGKVIPSGARVLIKPNLVLHRNEGPGGVECLYTHPSLIRAAGEAALRSHAAEVLVGDAPIQACNFEALLQETGLAGWAASLMARDTRFRGIHDFRRTTCELIGGVRVAKENLQPADEFTLFDLGRDSLLEPVSDDGDRFRVAWYDPRLMANTHRRGMHRYLVARAAVEADVIINLPKLKTHKKAGITCALKNLIGINGNKEYLPHHRVGGSQRGGDCYPGNGVVKRALEYVTDRQNLSSSYASASAWHLCVALLARTSRLQGDRLGTDGSWHGNDTIWRTCLDLNRILLYGLADGRMSENMQRRVIHIADAVIAGQGNGPLAPDPLALGLLLGGNNAAAVDWVGAQLLNYDSERIPLVRHAFDQFLWPIADFSPTALRVASEVEGESVSAMLDAIRLSIRHPLGWRAAASAQTEGRLATSGSESVASTNPWDA